MKVIRMNVYLEAEQKRLLEKLSEHTGSPVAELIRRAVNRYIELRKPELKGERI